MGRGSAQIFNIITIILLVLTVLVMVFVGVRMAQPVITPTPVALNVPTLAALPTETNTFTPSPTFTPTDTLIPTDTITPTIAPSLTFTNVPSVTASLTFTVIPSDTTTPIPEATATFSLTPSLTITSTQIVTPTDPITPSPTPINFTPQPTEPPPSPFPFALRENPVYTLNFANTAGCAWQGIGGQVYDINGQALIGVRVHVFGSGVDFTTTSGSNTLYGVSGWEVPLNNSLTGNSYTVELQSSGGTIISPQVPVQFTANDCARNLALVNFAQTRPF